MLYKPPRYAGIQARTWLDFRPNLKTIKSRKRGPYQDFRSGPLDNSVIRSPLASQIYTLLLMHALHFSNLTPITLIVPKAQKERMQDGVI